MSVVNNGPMYLISAEIKSPSYASSSRRVLGIPPCLYPLGIGFGGFPYRLPSGFDTWSRKKSANMFIQKFCRVLIYCYLLWAYQTIQSNPIQSISCWPSERVKFPTPPVASSQLVLATSLAQPSGPSKGMSAWASTEHGWQQHTKHHQNPGPVGRNFLRFRRFHTFFRWCETVAILQRPCVPLDLSLLHLPNGRGRTKLFQLPICKGRATDKQILNRLPLVRCKHQVTKHDFFHELILRICRCFMPSMPCPISSFESCFRSFFVWPSVRDTSGDDVAKFRERTNPQKKSPEDKKHMNVRADLLLPFMFFMISSWGHPTSPWKNLLFFLRTWIGSLKKHGSKIIDLHSFTG